MFIKLTQMNHIALDFVEVGNVYVQLNNIIAIIPISDVDKKKTGVGSKIVTLLTYEELFVKETPEEILDKIPDILF
jgi:hypothetical protein